MSEPVALSFIIHCSFLLAIFFYEPTDQAAIWNRRDSRSSGRVSADPAEHLPDWESARPRSGADDIQSEGGDWAGHACIQSMDCRSSVLGHGGGRRGCA